jgi:hypothetical protein
MTDLVAGRKLKSYHSSNKRGGRAGNGRRARRSRQEGARLGGTKIAKHAAAAGRASAACWNVSNGALAASQGCSTERMPELAELSMPFAFQSRYSQGATSNPICRARAPDRRFTSTKFPTRIFAALCRRYSPRPNSRT